jgi:GNAT superfamily N-acetyltransferase
MLLRGMATALCWPGPAKVMMTTPILFDASYAEDVRLNDGTGVHLRLVRPDDKPLLVAGFARLSPESRYRRFFSVKKELSEAELTYLTECDGQRHLAIAATRLLPDGTEEGLGVARFVRVSDDPGAAEAAVAVIDEYQSRGLGTLLLLRLIAAARERGIERFRAIIMTDNAPVLALLRDSGAHVLQAGTDGDVGVEVFLPEVLAPDAAATQGRLSGAAQRLLAAIAAGRASVRQRVGLGG